MPLLNSYDAASALDGSEELVCFQGGITKNMTPAQIAAYVATLPHEWSEPQAVWLVHGVDPAEDAAAGDVILRGGHAFDLAVEETAGGGIDISGGIGLRSLTVVDYTGLSGATLSVGINGLTPVDLVEGVDWVAETDNATTAENLAAALVAIGVTAEAASADVAVTPDGDMFLLTLVSDNEDLTVTAGDDGEVRLHNPAANSIPGAAMVDGSITAAKLANGAGLAALIAAGLGASAVYDHSADVGENELVAADAGARVAIVVAVCLEAPGGTTPAQFSVGEDGDEDKFLAVATLAAGTPGDVFIGAGTLTATEEVLVTVADGVDGTPAGQYAITVLILPAAA